MKVGLAVGIAAVIVIALLTLLRFKISSRDETQFGINIRQLLRRKRDG